MTFEEHEKEIKEAAIAYNEAVSRAFKVGIRVRIDLCGDRESFQSVTLIKRL